MNEQNWELKKEWQDAVIDGAFDKAQQNPNAFLNTLADRYGGATESSPSWAKRFRSAIESARSGNWSKAQELVADIVREKRDAIDVYLFGAIVSKKAGDPKQAMSHLSTLYSLRQSDEVLPKLSEEAVTPGGLVDSTIGSPRRSDLVDAVFRQYGGL